MEGPGNKASRQVNVASAFHEVDFFIFRILPHTLITAVQIFV